MALLTCVYPTAGTASVPVAVTASDTINGNDINAGANLTVLTVGTGTNVTIADPGHTPGGTAAATPSAVSIGTNSGKSWGANTLRNFIDPATNLVTVTYSATTAVTCLLIADGD